MEYDIADIVGRIWIWLIIGLLWFEVIGNDQPRQQQQIPFCCQGGETSESYSVGFRWLQVVGVNFCPRASEETAG